MVWLFLFFGFFLGQPFSLFSQESLEGKIHVRTLASNLDTPWQIALAPDGFIYLSERGGLVRVISPSGKLQQKPWLSLPEIVEIGEGGLLGLALDPNFSENGFIYLSYTFKKNKTLYNRLIRAKQVSITPYRLGRKEKILLDGIPAARFHNGGRLKFAPDGKLFWAIGDRLRSKTAQNAGSLNGKILRLHPDGRIPKDNPFGPNSYVYSLGHRNVQGIAIAQGFIFATEHGPSSFIDCCRDELNLIQAGANYGWPIIRGSEKKPGLRSPLIHSGETETWAPAGIAFINRGLLKNSLLFTGLRGQALYLAKVSGIEARNPKITKVNKLFHRRYGRLRDIILVPEAFQKTLHADVLVLTSNRDGRGRPRPNLDDRVLAMLLPSF